MSEVAMGFTVKSDSIPSRGARIAKWVDDHMQNAGVNIGELAFKIGVDKRDLRRLLNEKSCGPRLNDALEAAFQHDFMDAVAAPLIGGDRIAALEREIASERAKIAAMDGRLERERAARIARDAARGGQLRLVAEEDRSFDP